METVPNLVTVDLDESRARVDVAAITDGLLAHFGRGEARATFFVPRQLAEGCASLVRRIAEAGHEVGCLTSTRPAKAKPYCPSFASELEATRDAIEQVIGVRVRGHRNAAFAVDYESEWAYDVLIDRGIEYDSSRIPPKYVEFGYQRVPRAAHAVRRWGGTLIEVPVSTADVLSLRVRLGATSTIRGWPMPVWSALASGARARGEPLVMHLRVSELRPKGVERVGRIVNGLSFTSVASALPALYRTAPIIEN
jgi:peptidoglycan/xylan/chitin deacetylase (PgdA/CDA1 family)